MNLLAPQSLQGKVMYKQVYNDLMRNNKAPILKSIPYLDANYKPVIRDGRALTYDDVDFSEAGNTYEFEKKGNLKDVRKIVFIVSKATASASELAVNSFKAWPGNVTVRTVGKAHTASRSGSSPSGSINSRSTWLSFQVKMPWVQETITPA